MVAWSLGALDTDDAEIGGSVLSIFSHRRVVITYMWFTLMIWPSLVPLCIQYKHRCVMMVSLVGVGRKNVDPNCLVDGGVSQGEDKS
jgi:hypothetical protein